MQNLFFGTSNHPPIKPNTMQLTFQTAKEMYESGIPSIVKFAVENFPELAKPKYPKSWEELGKVRVYVINGDCTISKVNNCEGLDNKDIFHTKEQAEVSLALAQLSQLMAVYRNGWLPDWRNDEHKKYCLGISSNVLIVNCYTEYYHFLSFPDDKTAQAFATDHENLILKLKKF